MRYKDEFLQKINELHSKDITQQRLFNGAREQAFDLIESYFNNLLDDLKEVASVSTALKLFKTRNEFEIVYAANNSLTIPRYSDPFELTENIKVTIRSFGHITNELLEYKDGSYKSREFNLDLDSTLLDEYLKASFEECISRNLSFM